MSREVEELKGGQINKWKIILISRDEEVECCVDMN